MIDKQIDVNAELGDWLIRSEDGGKTWSEKIPTLVSSPHGPVELSDGRLLYAGNRTMPYSQRRRGSAHGDAIAVAQSKDDGKSWFLISQVPGIPADTYEPHIVETKSGILIMHIRVHKLSCGLLQSVSDDGGFSWTKPVEIGKCGYPAHLIRLRDGRILSVYGYRELPYGNQARISKDEGRSWSDPFIISADDYTTDLGYPSTVEMDDGSFITVWYEQTRGNPNAVLRMQRWSLNE